MTGRLLATLALLAIIGAAPAVHAATARESAVSALFDDVVSSPTRLRIFLKDMPKGGDLHNHLGGSVYAEDFLKWGAQAGYCANETDSGVVPPPCPVERSVKRLSQADPIAFDRLVDALSTRGYQQGVDRDDASGHTQFFGSFDRFGPIASAQAAKMMVATRRIAAGDKVSYIELMYNPAALNAYTLSAPDAPLDAAGLEAMYAREAPALGPVLKTAMAQLDDVEAEVQKSLGCGGPSADPACGVTVHYLTYSLRDMPPAQAFRSLLGAFALADKDPRFLGVNIVQPEDWPIALRDYDLHMAMFRFLEAKYPNVRRSLHAGELAFGLVPPLDLRDHIRKALDAGAERIGHGTDIALEDDARATMARMARDHVAVEINLTSNAVILGVKGDEHPLRLYMRYGVPVVLSTDDEGVLRTDMTNEYLRAAREQGLRYPQLKTIARASLTYSFIPGASLWKTGQVGVPVDACAASLEDRDCARFIKNNEKARLQAALERQFDRFETMELAVNGYGEMATGTRKTDARTTDD